MPKRSQVRESEGLEGRSERPAMWHGQPGAKVLHVTGYFRN
jgi:hypothetical protein